MKRLIILTLGLLVMSFAVSCDCLYVMSMENNYENGIYIWSLSTGLKTGDDPATLDELNDKWYLAYADAGQMGSFASLLGGKMTTEQFVDKVFKSKTDTLMVAIFDAQELDDNWGVGKMSDYVIQKYWLTKGDVWDENEKAFKRISFPPHESMKKIKMEPAYGTYPITKTF